MQQAVLQLRAQVQPPARRQARRQVLALQGVLRRPRLLRCLQVWRRVRLLLRCWCWRLRLAAGVLSSCLPTVAVLLGP
jgi:hypothetical protein